jgi:hypothetical protein
VTAGPAGDSDADIARAVLGEALAQVGAEERALLRVALTRAAGEVDEDTERMLKLLVRFDAGHGSTLPRAERLALASALRQFRGLSWTGSHEVAEVNDAARS